MYLGKFYLSRLLFDNRPLLCDQTHHSTYFHSQPLFYLPLHVFGCVCFVHILTLGQDKLLAKAMKCVFLGYSQLERGYRCHSPNINCISSLLMPLSLRIPPFLLQSVLIFLMTWLFPLSYHFWIYLLLHLQMFCIDLQVYTRCPRLTSCPLLTHLVCSPPPWQWSCPLPLILHEGTCTCNLYPIYNLYLYLYFALTCLLFLFLKPSMMSTSYELKKWLLFIQMAHEIWSPYLLTSLLLVSVQFIQLRFVRMVRWTALNLIVLRMVILRYTIMISIILFLLLPRLL